MSLGFSGEVAEYYAKFRRGYPPEMLDALQEAFALDAEDLVLDLGCGTGQLGVPIADRVRAVVGMDPEPDMLLLARRTAAERGVPNTQWMIGSDTDVPALGALLGPASLAMTVIGNALHWMDHDELFRVLRPLSRPGGGVAVLANGTPLWLQDSEWSRALRSALEAHFGWELKATCGTDDEARRRYADSLRAAGFEEVREIAIEYRDDLDLDQVIGGFLSATSPDLLSELRDRSAFTDRLRRTLPPPPYTEVVPVVALVGLAPQ